MSNIHLINQVRLWEQRLKIENEKVANLQGKPYTDAFSDPQPVRLERVSVLSRILKKKTHTQSSGCCYQQEELLVTHGG